MIIVVYTKTWMQSRCDDAVWFHNPFVALYETLSAICNFYWKKIWRSRVLLVVLLRCNGSLARKSSNTAKSFAIYAVISELSFVGGRRSWRVITVYCLPSYTVKRVKYEGIAARKSKVAFPFDRTGSKITRTKSATKFLLQAACFYWLVSAAYQLHLRVETLKSQWYLLTKG